jgi:two-component system sensor kinase
LEASVKELDAFSYSVSHDLRAPLRAIDGFSRIVEEDYATKLDDEGRRVIGVIRGEARRMGRLIDDLLAFSRLGRQRVEPTTIDMESMARKVFAELAALEPSRRIHLQLHPLPPIVGTEAMIRQLWSNLIGNAVKFTGKRESAEVEIGVMPGATGAHVYFVRDNGAGFDMRYADRLFGVFSRLHSTEEFPGTGVGLALAKRIIDRHGGTIRGEGEVNTGATFFFTIPDPGKQTTNESPPSTTQTP